MDPDTTWKQLLDAVAAGDRREAAQSARALLTWLDQGGFPPGVSQRTGLAALDATLARAGCRFAIHRHRVTR